MAVETLECPNCAAPLDDDGRTQFFCQFCAATVVVPESLRRDASPVEDAPLEPAPNLSRFDIEKEGDRLRIQWRWRNWMAFVLVPFGLLFAGFAVFWTVAATALAGPFGLLGLPFVGVGAFLLYFAAAMVVNRTTVLVEDGRIAVTHGPLPWRSPHPIEADDVRQLYVEERVHHGKNGSRSHTYEVQVLLAGGGKAKLVTEYAAADARAIERMIEVHLGIEDRAVRGEHAA